MSETMGFSPLSPHWFPPCAPFPPPHGCRRLYRSCSGIVPAAAVGAILNCCATSAVAASSWSASPAPFGPPRDSRRHKPMLRHALTRLISRSTPYLTFLQHQHLLSVSASAAPASMARPLTGPTAPSTQGIRFPPIEPSRSLHSVADRALLAGSVSRVFRVRCRIVTC